MNDSLLNFARRRIWFLPFTLCAFFFGLKTGFPDFYWSLVQEDVFLENLQFLFYFGASLLCVVMVPGFKRRNLGGLAILYVMMAAVLFFVAFEEISWGQRVFGFATPPLFESNVQQEATIHNLGGIQKYLMPGYVAAGLIGAFGYLLVPGGMRAHPWVQNLLPSPVFFLFFFPTLFVYALFLWNFSETVWLASRIGVQVYWRDQEPVELLFAAGIFFFLLFRCADNRSTAIEGARYPKRGQAQ